MTPRVLRMLAWCIQPATTLCVVVALGGVGARWGWPVAVFAVAPLLVVSVIGATEIEKALREEADYRRGLKP